MVKRPQYGQQHDNLLHRSQFSARSPQENVVGGVVFWPNNHLQICETSAAELSSPLPCIKKKGRVSLLFVKTLQRPFGQNLELSFAAANVTCATQVLKL